ncbi:MAG: hypothetical protein SO170_01845 [Butyribacter sp.]|nr:hypothetical protein [bacterium]MDY3853695.1 hypothetical protein [Butyribacter sp.]
MKVVTKLLRGAFLFATAAFLQVGISSADASAASILTKDVTIDYDKQQLKIAESGTIKDLEVSYAVATVKNVKKKGADGKYVTSKVMSATSWDTFDYKSGLVIDLSKLNRVKDNYIQLKGDKNTTPLVIKIPAVLTKVSAKFEPVGADVTLFNTTDKKNPVAIAGKTIQYRTTYSGWNTYSATDLSIYQASGATLYFRLAASTTQTLSAAASSATATDMVDAEGKAINAYVVGTFPGVESKVVIGKRANAPKVSADYNKHQFTLPKGTEYRVATASKLNAWTAASTTAVTKLNITDISTLVGSLTSATLEVRTAATKTKPESKVCQFAFNMPAETLAKSTNSTANKSDSARLAYDISANYVGASASAKDITVSYVLNAKTKKYTGIKFTNTTADTYQIVIVENGAAAPAASVTTLKTVLPGKKNTTTNEITEKETTITLQDNQQVYIRKIGNSKTKEWSSNFEGLGTVKFPEVTAE